MRKSQIRERLNGKKIFILFVSFVVAVNIYFAAYFYLSRNLTDHQRNQPLDVLNGKGLTRAYVYVNSASAAGISFVLTAGTLLFLSKKKKDEK